MKRSLEFLLLVVAMVVLLGGITPLPAGTITSGPTVEPAVTTGPCPPALVPNPSITGSFFPDSSCLPKDDLGAPDGGRHCLHTCELQYSTFCTPLNGSNTYTWNVTGGIITGGAGTNCVTVLWGPMGTGSISVLETANDSCSGADTACVEIIASPVASFTGSATACLNTPVNFLNTSTGASTYTWDFGDGSPLLNTFNASHAYATPGSYTVTLVAFNQCGCADSATAVIDVSSEPGPVIDCPATVCAFEDACYSTSSGCPTAVYSWIVTGGVPLGPTNTPNLCVQWGAGPVGTVSLVITGCGGLCPDTTTVIVPIVSPSATIAGPNPVCTGEVGTYTLPTWPGTYYNWTLSGGGIIIAGSNTQALSIQWGITPGNYLLSCYWNDTTLGCSGTDSILIKVRDKFVLYANPGTYCLGDSTQYFASSAANWTVGGGNAFTGNGTSSITVYWSTPGTHTVTATSTTPGAYCNPADSVTATVILVPTAASITGPAVACSGTPYQYTATPSGAGYTFLWSVTGGGTIIGSPTANPVTVQWSGPGTISVQQVQISPPSCPSAPISMGVSLFSVAAITGPDTVCMDQTAVFTAGGPNPFIDYQWTIEDGFGNPSSAGSIVSGQGSNAVTVQWNGPGGNAVVVLNVCSITLTHPVVILPKPTPTINVAGTVCAGGGGSALLSLSGSYSSYLWSNGDTTATSLISASGPYSVTVTNANGCIGTATINVPAAPAPVASISTPDTITYCLPATINTTLYALVGTGYTYTWYPGAIVGGPTYVVPGTGTFYVVVTDANGCSSTSNTITVSALNCSGGGVPCVPEPYTLAILDTVQTPNCNIINFGADTANVSSLSWSFGDGGTAGNVRDTTHTWTSAGYYTVTLCGSVRDTSGSGFCAVCTTLAVAIPVAADFDTLVACDSVTFTELATNLPANTITSYSWSFPGGSPSSSALQVPPTVYYATPGTHSVTLTVSDGSCQATITKTVTTNPPPSGTFTLPPTVCAGVNIPINGVGSGITTWTWDFGDASTSAIQNTSHTWAVGGTFIVTLTVTDAGNCVGTFADTITVYPPDTTCSITPATTTPVCQGDSVLLTASAGTGYQWLFNGAPIGGATLSTYYASVTGNYSVIVYDANGCPCTTDVVAVTVNPPPVVNPTANPGPVLCDTTFVTLNSYFDGTYTYSWTQVSGPPESIFNPTAVPAYVNVSTPGTYVFQVLVVDSYGCTDSATVTLLLHPSPAPPVITPSGSTILCKGDSVTLTSSSATGNLWNTAATTQSITVKTGGVYTVTVTDANGCPASASITVTTSIADFSLFPFGCDSLCDSAMIPGPIGPYPGYYTYQWQLNGVNISPPSGTNQQLTTTSSGNYSLILTGPAPAFCMDTSGLYNVTISSCDSVCASTICGRKWNDKNGDHKFNYGNETGIFGWKICLVECNQEGYPTGDTIACTTTDSNGFYCFTNLCPGDYCIVEENRPGWQQTWPANPPFYHVTVGDSTVVMGMDFGNKWKKLKLWATKDTIGVPNGFVLPSNVVYPICYPWPFQVEHSTDDGENWTTVFDGVVTDNSDIIPGFLPGMYRVTRQEIANFRSDRIYLNDTLISDSVNNVVIINFPDSSHGASLLFLNTYEPDTTKAYRTFTADQLAGDDQKKPVKRAKRGKPVLMPNTANVVDEILKQGIAVVVGVTDKLTDAGKAMAYLLPGKQSNVFKTFNHKSVRHTGTPHGFDFNVKGKPILKRQKVMQPTKHNNRFLANLLALKINIAASDAGKTPPGFADLIYLDTQSSPWFTGQADWTVEDIAELADDIFTDWQGVPYQEYEDINAVLEILNASFADVMPIGPEDTLSWMGGKLALNGARPLADVPVFIDVDGIAAPRTLRFLSEFPTEPGMYVLEQNYPNPFNPTTTIRFSLEEPAVVSLKIFSMLGEEIETLVGNEFLDEGSWDYDFDAARLSSGIYIYQLTVRTQGDPDSETGPESYREVRKMLLLK